MQIIFLSLVVIIARLIPHAANFVPIFVLCALLIKHYKKSHAIILFFSTLLISDILLYFLKGYDVFSSWMFINYLSYTLLFIIPKSKFDNALSGAIMFPLVFWISSNFLVWLLFGYYQHTVTGLLSCFMLALPFLKTSILANSLWSMVIYYEKLIPHSTRGS